MLAAEVGRQAVAFDALEQHVAVLGQARHRRPRPVDRSRHGEVEPTAMHVVERARVMPGHLLVGDRPSALGDVVAALEVDRIERNEAPSPDAGGAAESRPTELRRLRMRRRCGPRVRVAGRFAIRLQAAGLEKQHVEAAAIEFAGERDAGRAGTDDADGRRAGCGFEGGRVLEDHRGGAVGGACARPSKRGPDAGRWYLTRRDGPRPASDWLAAFRVPWMADGYTPEAARPPLRGRAASIDERMVDG